MSRALPILAVISIMALVPLAVPASMPLASAAPQAAGCPPQGGASADPECYFAWGLDAYARRDFDSAVDYLSHAIDLDPANPSYYNWRGMAYAGNRDYERATSDLSAAIGLAPGEPAWRSNRAWVYAMRGYSGEAIADLTAAIQLSPTSAFLYGSRADVYGSIADYDRAIADYSRAIELDPGSASLYFRRGVSYDYKRDYDQAIADKTRAIATDPDRAEYYFSLSLSFRAKGDTAQADRNLALATAKGYRPPAAPAAPTAPTLVREYQERDNQGRVRTVQQWSDGRYTATPWETPAAPAPAPVAQNVPAAPNYLKVTILGYDFAKSVYKVRVGWKPSSDNHTGFVLTSDNLPTPLDMGPAQTSIDFWAAGSQGAWICVSVAAKNCCRPLALDERLHGPAISSYAWGASPLRRCPLSCCPGRFEILRRTPSPAVRAAPLDRPRQLRNRGWPGP